MTDEDLLTTNNLTDDVSKDFLNIRTEQEIKIIPLVHGNFINFVIEFSIFMIFYLVNIIL